MGKNADNTRRIQREAEYRRKMEAEEAARTQFSDQERTARLKAGLGNYARGVGSGFAEEAADNGRSLADLTVLGARLAFSPLDHLLSPEGQSAGDQLGRGVVSAVGTGADYVRHPLKSLAGAGQYARDSVLRLDPVSGSAATVDQQQQRVHEAGRNAGKLLFNVAGMTEGAGALKTLSDFGYLGKGLSAERYLALGAPQKEANYFSDLYKPGQGSHFIPQRTKLFGRPLPKAFMDSPFNRIMPAPGATNGQAAKAHFIRDDRYNGGRISGRHGGGGWSGQRLGWTKPPTPVRWWLGAPIPMRVAGIAGLTGLASLAYPGDDHNEASRAAGAPG